MTVRLSRRSARLEPSEIRNMSVECERLGGINLAQGVCDTPAPEVVRRVAREAIDAGVNSYTRFDGLRSLRTAIAGKVKREIGLDVDAETQVTVSVGSTGAMYAALMALLDRGDEVILFEPYYGYHLNALHSLELTPQFVPTRPPDWTFELNELRSRVTDRTRAIIVNTPTNPSGKVFTRGELEAIADLAIEKDLVVLTDEIYEYFVFDGREHVSPAALASLRDRTVLVSGFSKTFSITGWRLGYSVAPPEIAAAIGAMTDLVYVCAPAPLQQAVAVALGELAPEFYRALSCEYEAKRARICAALSDAGLAPYPPQGAYYVLADVSQLPGATSKERAMHILEATGVASVPGEAFYSGDGGRDLVRFCFAKTDDDLAEACRRLRGLS